MAEDLKLTSALQLSVLAALCFDQGHGAAIAAQVRPEYFDDIWRGFASQVLAYRRKYSKPPGENYLDDLAAQATVGRDGSLLKKRLLPSLFEEAEGLNAEYTANRVHDFVRRQLLKRALFDAGDRFAQDNEELIPDVENILRKALQVKQQPYSTGTFLNDSAGLRYIEPRDDFIPIGIPELDKMRIGLAPKELLLYIAPKGSGKTWFCVHCGTQAILQRLKVVHYSLEMDEEKVIPRYYQSLFAVATSADKFNRTELEFNELKTLIGTKKTKLVRPKLSFSQPGIKKFLREKMKSHGARLGSLLIKSYPTGSLTISQLTSHLDYLQEVEKFVPNILIIDYPKLMRLDRNNLRVDLGSTVEELRGIASTRNIALLAPHQGTRATIGAKRVRSSMAGEDISVVQTADTVLTYSRTQEEERRGLGRLSVEHARGARSGDTFVLSQSYNTGQYVLQSAIMQKAYWDRVKGEDDE